MGTQPRPLVTAVYLVTLLSISPTPACPPQEAGSQKADEHSDLAAVLGFEVQPNGDVPGGWNGWPAGTVFADNEVVHSGRWSARIERNAASPNNFSNINKSIPIDFSGATIELRGFLRTEDVSNFAGLWLREDSDSSVLTIDNMQGQKLRGTTSWKEYSVRLPLHPEARRLVFGALLVGTGKVWADDLQLLVDGKPVWEAPRVERPKTAVDLDHEFDGGSGISITQLSAIQIENLATLGKVWGFLKYYHPAVTSGQHHWDYELFRALPAVLAAKDRAAANAILLHWIEGLGDVALCNPCATLDVSDLQFGPDLGWTASSTLLGPDLSMKLAVIRDNRLTSKQFYVSKMTMTNNPSFDHELGYAEVKLSDSGFQLLSLYRFWNIVEYWSPYRDLLGSEWNDVLTEFIPRFAMAKDMDSYKREVFALLTKFGDGHASLWGSLDAQPPVGKCELPVNVRFVESVPVITELRSGTPGNAGGLEIGDVITELDGMPVAKLVESWEPYYPASNSAGRMFKMGRSMTRGDCGETEIGIRRDSTELKLKVKRVAMADDNSARITHDLPGSAFRLLSKDVAYLKLSSVKAQDAVRYVDQAAGTKGLIIDIRNYPSEFMVFALGSLLVDSDTPFARFTQGDLSNPGAFHWTKPEMLHAQKPHYAGKIVILVDEASISQAEYTAMAFRSAPKAIVVGSKTAGADGNVSRVALPGGLETGISGIGVFYPDKTPTQRIGIVPNIEAKPTIAGIRAHRDEVLEEALRQILGRGIPSGEIEKMAKP